MSQVLPLPQREREHWSHESLYSCLLPGSCLLNIERKLNFSDKQFSQIHIQFQDVEYIHISSFQLL